MTNDLEGHLNKLSSNEKDELFSLVESIENDEHKWALEVIENSPLEIPDGYKFLHYCVKTVGKQETTSLPERLFMYLKENENSPRFEVLAIFKNPSFYFPDNREFITKSVLYVNNIKSSAYLNGKKIDSEMDEGKFIEDFFDAIYSVQPQE